jgi:hypothetical protein
MTAPVARLCYGRAIYQRALPMTAIYLYVNAALYALFAVWITLSPAKTAANQGYALIANGGRSEYLVVYGGLQVGLALFFAWTAQSQGLQRAGLVFALLLYAPIVVYRMITVARFWPVASTTLAVAALEILLLVWAVVLVLRTRAIFMS